MHRTGSSTLLVLLSIVFTHSSLGAPPGSQTKATLNGTRFVFDSDSGALLRLAYDGPGAIIDTQPEFCGLLDCAYPLDQFEPLRLGAQYSSQPRIDINSKNVTVRWDRLGASRPFELPGDVSAVVEFEAMGDGRSILARCKIDNQSERPVRQVLFPDLVGLRPIAGEVWTEFRTCGFMNRPFQVLQPRQDAAWYVADGADVLTYQGGSAFQQMVGRWMDFGGHQGGLSVYPRVWAGDPLTTVRLHRPERHGTLRIHHVHDVRIEPGASWQSPDYVLTPHRNGWPEGIEPYRDWVHDHVDRVVPMPEHVEEGLGFRTIWMCKGYPTDGDRDVDFYFRDLVEVARECKAHGLDELMVWFWEPPFQMPAPPPYSHLGDPSELKAAIDRCHEMGVNVALFISWMSLSEPSASRYGVTVVPGGWNYHPEMVPRWNPPYARERSIGGAIASNEQYQKDVIESVRHIAETYSASIGWDQVYDPQLGPLYEMFDAFRPIMHAMNPESTFAGESVVSIEKDASYLDYTWIWMGYRDFRPYHAAFPSPRMNVNVNRDWPIVKHCFVDNTYVNIMPSKADGPNATAMIEDYPQVSEAVKTCASLRQRFLPYFVEGKPLGHCVVDEPTYGLYVSGYALPDRLLVLAMNVVQPQAFELKVDLGPWLESSSGDYSVKCFDETGQETEAVASIPARWSTNTGDLGQYEIVAYEFDIGD